MPDPRCPGLVEDPAVPAVPGVDTDGDGNQDTVVLGDGVDLVLRTDLDGDGYLDRVLRIGPDGVAREVGFRPDDDRLPGWFDDPLAP
jgi:hypothetical protein